MIKVALVDDHELLRTGIRAILEAEDDLEVVGRGRRRRRPASTWSCARIPTSC